MSNIQQTHSLDIMAAQQSLRREDSRSSSSSNSPVRDNNEESDFFLGANDSQSSLGVPNLQDMQVNDDECLPPINRLPNEILISIFAKLSQSSDILRCMLTCKRWARNAVDILWHRPACTTWERHQSICQTLGLEQPYFSYRDFIKRLNLAALADQINDGSVSPLASCTRVERLTLTNCKNLTDSGLIALVKNSTHLLALDVSGDDQITEASIYEVAEHCRRLQGLNISSCNKISNESMIKLAENCRYIKRLKLNDCGQLTDNAVLAFAQNCPNILEIDLHQCKLIGNEPVTSLLAKGQSLRELRLANCELIDDGAFLSLPSNRVYEHLRILDLTSCARLTDRAVERIIDVAPRLRNLVLAKCRNITDAAVYAISKLGKNLHYVHLGHCGHITDDAVKRLVASCNRIRYIDLGCCVHLTDDSITKLATLPKLKRIGLVKCSNITDLSVEALARANQRHHRQRRDADGNVVPGEHYPSHSSLERVHLSYCTNLTLKSIIRLLNSCPRLTHLSLTGVVAFLREDLAAFCRDAPPEFTEHQRSVFCVFSGQGVIGLRRYLNSQPSFADFQDGQVRQVEHAAGAHAAAAGALAHNIDAAFDDGEPDVVDDDDGLDDGSEMVIDTQPLLGHAQPTGMTAGAVPPPPPPAPASIWAVPPPPPAPGAAPFDALLHQQAGGLASRPSPSQVYFDSSSSADGTPSGVAGPGGHGPVVVGGPPPQAMSVNTASFASLSPSATASAAGPNFAGVGASTASTHGHATSQERSSTPLDVEGRASTPSSTDSPVDS